MVSAGRESSFFCPKALITGRVTLKASNPGQNKKKGWYFLGLVSSSPRFLGDRIRKIWVDRLPYNPLSPDFAPEIEVLIPTHGKDIEVLQTCIRHLEKYCQNPISQITIVSPKPLAAPIESQSRLSQVLDRDLLTPVLVGALKNIRANHGEKVSDTWILQQLLKLQFVLKSKCETGILVLDSDTLLLRPRVFLDFQGVQLLVPSYEYHKPYFRHSSMFADPSSTSRAISFVSHHQLFRPQVLRTAISDERALAAWATTIKGKSGAPISEYHFYGQVLTSGRFDGGYVLGAFKNVALPRSTFFSSGIQHTSRDSGTASVHTYL
jgi:hypothetical protein